MIHDTPTAEDLRSERARAQIRIYELGARVGLHPARLGQVLSGRLPLTPELAQRIYAAIHGEVVDSR